MSNEEDTNPTYIELVVEARWNATEKKETISSILRKFLRGEIYEDERSSFEASVYDQMVDVRKKLGPADLNALIREGRTWEVT